MKRICFTLFLVAFLVNCGDDETKTINISPPTISCEEAKAQVLCEKCSGTLLRLADIFLILLNECPNGECIRNVWGLWVVLINGPCNPGYDTLLAANRGKCGNCYESCGLDFNLYCLFKGSDKTGTQCVRELYECIEQCDL